MGSATACGVLFFSTGKDTNATAYCDKCSLLRGPVDRSGVGECFGELSVYLVV